jgi:C4-dicarboxylate transporter DctQ subunit
MVFIGISYGVKKGSHMRIDMLEHFFPRLKKPLGFFADVCFLAFAVIMIKPGLKVLNAIKLSGQTSPAAGVPMHFVYTGLLVGFSLVIIRTIQKFVLMFTKKGEK